MNDNDWSAIYPPAGPASMDAGFNIASNPDQPTINHLGIQTGNWGSTGVSMQPENFKPVQDTVSYLTEPLGNACSAAYELDATVFACNQDVPVSTHPNTVDLEGYGYVEVSHDAMLMLAELNDFWLKREGNKFSCNICKKTLTRPDNVKRHLRNTTKCKTVWERRDKVAWSRILHMAFSGKVDWLR
ncbi:hypothetical protein CT0861_02825 [Colletotrichum tofieldiae]|uniref:C2H2-type domain-containing protein n=1 Tax=Colletotrichum tofieldiae TaxID=708197 RepID=A0A161W3N5_9PEZI|nr:hypothetical protein CT0861_02825 [Colletotrichum tofieldiae]